MRRSPARLALSLAFAFAFSPLALAADPVLEQAQLLINQQQSQAAFDLLAPLEDERSGAPDYDYLYGLAALNSGKPGIAAFAFERCLAVEPTNGPCRVLMARTHLELGENQSARLELETVQSSEPPAEVKALVSQYLGVADQQETAAKRRIGAYAQVGLGYDSNVTSITDNSQIAIPSLGGTLFSLVGISSKQEDPFAQAEAGADFAWTVSPSWRLLGDASISTRRYDDIDAFDSQSGGVGLGAVWHQGPSTLLTRLQAQDYQLGDNAFRSLYGASTQYQHARGDNAAVTAYLQASRLDYHLGTPDADRYALGAGYSRALELRFSPVLYAGLYTGLEDSRGRGFVSQDFHGLRLGGSLGLTETLRLTSSLNLEQREFDSRDMAFQVVREDTGVDLSLGAIYQAGPHLSLRPAYTYTSNDSNIVLSDFDRHVVSLDLRYEM